MCEYLKLLDDCEVRSEHIIYYKKKPVTKMNFFPANGINFILKDSYIEFNTPCICGFYSDEEHKHI